PEGRRSRQPRDRAPATGRGLGRHGPVATMKRLAVCIALSLIACERPPAGGSSPGVPPPSSPVAQGRQLLEAGQLDAALAKLQEIPNDPDALYLQGCVGTKRAETPPLPPPPPSSGSHGASPRAPEFKSEELQALDCFEKAVAA